MAEGPPIVLATWSFGRLAVEAAWPIIARSPDALDAVEVGCMAVEDDPGVHSVGYGGLPDRTGRVSLDGSIMRSPAESAGVAGLRRCGHPVSAARRVMERTEHKLLVGPDADDFARAMGLAERELLSPYARQAYSNWQAKYPDVAIDPIKPVPRAANLEEDLPPREQPDHDTVGVLALDASGQLAGACSTSGLAYKVAGRVGDSPIIGHGLYVDPHHGAAVTTGVGELATGICATFLAVEHMRRGDPPAAAAQAVLQRIIESYDLSPDAQLGIITLAPNGQWSSASLREGFSVAVHDGDGYRQAQPERVMLP